MIIKEKETVKALKEAYKYGYEIVPMANGILHIYTEHWALLTRILELPLAVSQLLVEHAKHIPVEPELVRAGRGNQLMMAEEVWSRKEELADNEGEPVYIHQIPIIFKEHWQLFATSEGDVHGYDKACLDMLGPGCPTMLVQPGGCGQFILGNEQLIIAPAYFGPEDSVKVQKIAELYREQKLYVVEEPENLCLFDINDEEE